jgi:Flp pilus assembly protein TadD
MFASTRSLDAPSSIGSANDTQLVPFPVDPRIHEYRAIGLAARRRCTEAERELDAFVAARPYHWGAWIDVARCYAETGNHGAARRMRAGALAFEPHVDALEHSGTPSR